MARKDKIKSMNQLPAILRYLDPENKEQTVNIHALEDDLARIRKAGEKIEFKAPHLTQRQAIQKFYAQEPKSRWSWSLITAGVFATVLIGLVFSANRYYYLFMNEKEIVELSNPVNLKRKGLFWGSFKLRAHQVVFSNDIIQDAKAPISVPHVGIVYLKKGSALSLKKQNAAFQFEMKKGEGLIDFEIKEPLAQRAIRLINGEILEITGTVVYLDRSEKSMQFILLEGQAQLSQEKIKPGFKYSVINGRVQKAELDMPSQKELLISFKRVIPEELEKRISPVVESRSLEVISDPLSYFKKKYGSVYKVVLKNKKTFYAAKLGENHKTIRFRTSRGIKRIPKENILGVIQIK